MASANSTRDFKTVTGGRRTQKSWRKHFKNKYVAVTYISIVGQLSTREALFVRLRYHVGIAGFVFENNKLTWQAHVAEEKINGQVFHGHERNLTQKILAFVRAAVAQSEPPKIA